MWCPWVHSQNLSKAWAPLISKLKSADWAPLIFESELSHRVCCFPADDLQAENVPIVTPPVKEGEVSSNWDMHQGFTLRLPYSWLITTFDWSFFVPLLLNYAGACKWHVPCKFRKVCLGHIGILAAQLWGKLTCLDGVLHIKALSIMPDVIWWEVLRDRIVPFWRVRYFTSICDVHVARLPLMWTSVLAELSCVFPVGFLAPNQISSYGAC